MDDNSESSRPPKGREEMQKMLLTFYLTFVLVGPKLSEIMSKGISAWTGLLASALDAAGAPGWLCSLLIDGVCAGVGSVLSFIPVIGVLFFCLSIMEETGCMNVLARLLDRCLSPLGIPGQTAVTMIMGFGCSVPAILAADTITDKRAKRLALTLIPFMSCSAKLPLYGMMTPVFFPDCAGLVTCVLYIIGIFAAVLVAVVLKNIAPAVSGLSESSGSFTGCCRCRFSELRMPSMAKVFSCVWENIRGFFRKAFTVVLAASVIIWLLQNCGAGFTPAGSPEESLLAAAGRFIAPVFAPLGFGDWRAAAALITGLSAKEAVVSTFVVLAEGGSGGISTAFSLFSQTSIPVGTATSTSLSFMLEQIFTPLSAFSFLVFFLLYAPCAASMTVLAKTSGSLKRALSTFVFQTAAAWLAAFIIYNTGQILNPLIF